jgi:hypothetical protein|mmetsp:Transcript_11648/g.34188  ORF Transcript_11648/g.34188 Transcript_11648/m.34188 type:complete len:99 (-) Transcript_11648:1398-1694(-)
MSLGCCGCSGSSSPSSSGSGGGGPGGKGGCEVYVVGGGVSGVGVGSEPPPAESGKSMGGGVAAMSAEVDAPRAGERGVPAEPVEVRDERRSKEREAEG